MGLLKNITKVCLFVFFFAIIIASVIYFVLQPTKHSQYGQDEQDQEQNASGSKNTGILNEILTTLVGNSASNSSYNANAYTQPMRSGEPHYNYKSDQYKQLTNTSGSPDTKILNGILTTLVGNSPTNSGYNPNAYNQLMRLGNVQINYTYRNNINVQCFNRGMPNIRWERSDGSGTITLGSVPNGMPKLNRNNSGGRMHFLQQNNPSGISPGNDFSFITNTVTRRMQSRDDDLNLKQPKSTVKIEEIVD